jgi:hypothetical protein
MTWQNDHSVERRDRSTGQALVEFTLIAPMLFLLLIGVFEAARFVVYQETLNHAAREGARYAIVHGARGLPQVGPLPDNVVPLAGHDPTGDTVRQAVRDAAVGMLDPSRLTIPNPCWLTSAERTVPARGTDCSHGNNGRGSPVTVWVDYTYDSIVGEVLGLDFIPTITISVESTHVVNN